MVFGKNFWMVICHNAAVVALMNNDLERACNLMIKTSPISKGDGRTCIIFRIVSYLVETYVQKQIQSVIIVENAKVITNTIFN